MKVKCMEHDCAKIKTGECKIYIHGYILESFFDMISAVRCSYKARNIAWKRFDFEDELKEIIKEEDDKAKNKRGRIK